MHSQHWIHRDIKPENIFWTPDGVVLADFGYAAQSTDWSCLSNCEGTIVYMAPEVARKHYAYPGMSKSLFESKFPQHKNYLEYVHSLSTATTTASDIYSLGVTMFCLMFQRLIHHEHGKQSIPFVGTGLRV
jgi:serine/threonine protein kinase